MKIYADILVLVNIYIDYFILLAVKRFLHLEPKTWRLIAAAALGGFSGLCSLLPVPYWVSWFMLAFAAFCICFAAFYKKNLSVYIRSVVCYFTFSLIFSGVIIVLVEFFQLNATVIGGRAYFDISPVLLVVFTVAAYIISVLLEQIKGRKAPGATFCRVIIENGSAKKELFTKIDTGSSLKEPFSDLPVIVAEKEALQEVLPEEVLQYQKNAAMPAPGLRLVPFGSLGGNGLLPAFKAQNVYFKDSGKKINCYIAVYEGKLSASGIEALMNPELAENM